MGETGHKVVGITVGVMVAAWLRDLGYPLLFGVLGGCAAYPGATAPDWLEISGATKDWLGHWDRHSVIPHRTITHWWPIWIIPVVFAVGALCCGTEIENSYSRILWVLLLGFCAGGISHLLCDVPNPTGIPILGPGAKHRWSLHWWRSGSPKEWVMVLGFGVLAVIAWKA